MNQTASGPGVTNPLINYFGINQETGELRVTRPIDYEDVHSVFLNILATDDCPSGACLSSMVSLCFFRGKDKGIHVQKCLNYYLFF